jgi:hypothetical protein
MKAITILSQINEFNENQLIELNNIYCQVAGYYDNEVYNNDEDFFSTFYPNPGDGLKVAQAIFYGDYNYSHDYVKFNGYGNLESINYFEVSDLCELPSTMAEFIEDNFSDFDHLFNSNTEED